MRRLMTLTSIIVLIKDMSWAGNIRNKISENEKCLSIF
jgi:hypothetical protein